jgi:glycosyltransferase involved in cell wall biosynthesis
VKISVVIRSYNRLEALCELLEIVLGQRHDSFEVIVIDQSTELPPAAVAKLAEHERDPRLRVVRVPPLGGSKARNLGIVHARGEIVVCVDDDDLPVGPDFLTGIERPFDDPKCMGATCRHVWASREISPIYRFYAWRRCMQFSPVLRLPYTYPRYDRPRRDADYVHGSGGAIRRSVLELCGGWDEDAPVEDETSLGIRVGRALRERGRGEYLAFDPGAILQRRMDVPGGLDKRFMGSPKFYRRFMTFVHHILGRYHPVRVRALYPLYVLAGWRWTVAWIWADSQAHSTIGKKLLGTLAFTFALPWHATRMLKEPLGQLPGTGVAVREKLLPAAPPP